MPETVLVCDDSALARRQLARALPAAWAGRVCFAANGREALDRLREMAGDGVPPLLFLDLNMPELDGYGVLEALRREGLLARVVVVSGDIQPQARQRVLELGALGFVRKPASPEELQCVLRAAGLAPEGPVGMVPEGGLPGVGRWEAYRELANVATGRAADLLARLLKVFVLMPRPHVSTLTRQDLLMILAQVAGRGPVTAVCQGFVAPRLAGEALLLFDEASVDDLVALVRGQSDSEEQEGENRARGLPAELTLDVTGILVSAFLRGLAEQLDLSFHQGPPRWLGQEVRGRDLLRPEQLRWRQVLAMEVSYRLEGRPLRCDLLLLFTEDSIPALDERLSYLVR